MTTLRFDIPVEKIPALATAAILAGQDLGSWTSRETQDDILAAPVSDEVVADGRIVLENLDDVVARQKDTEPTVSDFFADIV